jgi:hypothetical protein
MCALLFEICKYVYQVKGVCHSPSAYPTIIIWQQIPHHREGIHKQPPLNVLSSSVCTSKAHNWYIISIVYFRSTKRAAENIYIYSNLHCYDSGLQSLSLLVRKFFPNRMADIITVLNSFLVYCALFFSFIDIDTACTNTAINWNCPGGYIKVHNAIWQTVNYRICNKTANGIGTFNVIAQMKNKCDNKTSCNFTVNDSSFGASCDGKCSGLSYTYECISKSLVLRIFLII